MLTIYLARHGQDQDNAQGILNGHRDMPLTKKGIKQAHNLADKIKKAGIIFNGVYSSPLKRAYQTAQIITDSLAYPKPEKLNDLIERDFGLMTGKPVDQIERLCSPHILKAAATTYFLSAPKAETFPQLIQRAQRLLRQLQEKHRKEGSILLVSHGDFGKMLYAAYYKLDWKKVLEMLRFDNAQLLILSPNCQDKKF